MYVSDEALVLRRRKFSETSLVLACFTRSHGRIDALAKGARREKSPMKGHFDLYTREEVTFFRKRNGALDLATAAALVDEYTPLRGDAMKFAAAGVLCELLLHGCLPGQPHPQAFTVATGTLEAVAKAPAVETCSLLMRGVLGLLADFGFSPRLQNCCRCTADLTGRSSEPVTDTVKGTRGIALNGRAGGLLCGNCAGEAGNLPAAAVRGLQLLAASHDVKFSGAAWQLRLLEALEGYCSYVLERPCRSFKVFRELWGYQKQK